MQKGPSSGNSCSVLVKKYALSLTISRSPMSDASFLNRISSRSLRFSKFLHRVDVIDAKLANIEFDIGDMTSPDDPLPKPELEALSTKVYREIRRRKIEIRDDKLVMLMDSLSSVPFALERLGRIRGEVRESDCANRAVRLLDLDHRPVILWRCSGYRSPSTVILEAALSTSRRSSDVSLISSEPMFSSRRDNLVVPGIGTIHGF